MQDPRMQQMPTMQDPRMQQMPTMQDPRMQQMAMMQDPRMQGPPMEGPMMQNPTSSSDLATAASPVDNQSPTMQPVSGYDMTTSLKSILGQKGPVSLSLPSIQNVMNLESRLHEAREDILRSFYRDLLKYRDLSQQVQAQLSAKLALLYQIETQLATPLRYILATQSTTPSLNLPITEPSSQPSMIITRLRNISESNSQLKPTYSPEE